MDKQLFYHSLFEITKAKIAFETLEELSFHTIDPYVKMFGLPMETHAIHYVQKLRCHLQNAISYHYGVKHLSNAKYPALAHRELDICRVLTKNLIDLDILKYNQMYTFLFNADPI